MSDPVSLLERLVTFRSDRMHGNEHALAVHLGQLLRERQPEEVHVVDVSRPEGTPSAYVYARFGRPRFLVNAHLDTVPPNADWISDPFSARTDAGRLHALGAADTKGAIAAILCALEEATPKDTAILFSGDEEFSSVAMNAFLTGPHNVGIERAIVCEPTNLALGTRHRGFVAFEVTVDGPGGHSSRADTLPAPIALLARLAVELDGWSERQKPLGPPGFLGMCLNLAKLEGGVAFNVVPAQSRLSVSLRPPPGADATSICNELEGIIRRVVPQATVRFHRKNASFATNELAFFQSLVGPAARKPIDLGFWTEAALLAANGIDAVVMGPGDIAQAHAPNEWVALDELHRARDTFRAIFERLRS